MAKVERDNHENITQKTKDCTTRTSQKPRCSGRVGMSCSNSATHHVTLFTNPVIKHEI